MNRYKYIERECTFYLNDIFVERKYIECFPYQYKIILDEPLPDVLDGSFPEVLDNQFTNVDFGKFTKLIFKRYDISRLETKYVCYNENYTVTKDNKIIPISVLGENNEI